MPSPPRCARRARRVWKRSRRPTSTVTVPQPWPRCRTTSPSVTACSPSPPPSKRKLDCSPKVADESEDESDDNTIEDPGKDSETAVVPTADIPPEDPNAEHSRGVQRTEDDDESEASEMTPVRARRHVGAAPGTAVASRVAASMFTALDGVDGKRPGEMFADPLELSAALIDRAHSIREDTDEHFPVGSIKGTFERRLTNDWMENLRMFEGEELTAALCAPFTPNYNLACMNTTRRPVRASLPTFEAPPAWASRSTRRRRLPTSPAATASGRRRWTQPRQSNEKVCTDDHLRHPRRLPDVRRVALHHDPEHAADVVPRAGRRLAQPVGRRPGPLRRDAAARGDGRRHRHRRSPRTTRLQRVDVGGPRRAAVPQRLPPSCSAGTPARWTSGCTVRS